MKDYRVEVKVKNNYLFRLMQSYGLNNAAELSRASGLAQGTIGKVLNLKAPALTKKGEVTVPVQTLCDFFVCSVYDLFPPQHINDPLETNFGAVEANMEELASSNLLAGGTDPLQILSDGDATDLLAAAVGTLTDREQQIMNLRYGLNEEPPKTLYEIGEIVGVNAARIGQIEQKALRKLRSRATASLAYAHSDEEGEHTEKRIVENEMAVARQEARQVMLEAKRAQERLDRAKEVQKRLDEKRLEKKLEKELGKELTREYWRKLDEWKRQQA